MLGCIIANSIQPTAGTEKWMLQMDAATARAETNKQTNMPQKGTNARGLLGCSADSIGKRVPPAGVAGAVRHYMFTQFSYTTKHPALPE